MGIRWDSHLQFPSGNLSALGGTRRHGSAWCCVDALIASVLFDFRNNAFNRLGLLALAYLADHCTDHFSFAALLSATTI